MSFNCWSQARLASIISTSALVGLTLEPSRLPELTRASGSDGNAPPPTTRNRPSRPLATLEPTGEASFSRPTCCGWLGSPPFGTIQIEPYLSILTDSAGRQVHGPCSPTTGLPSPVVRRPVSER